jgi:pimeloyl-ACP methyl ester carboxylesterase
MIKNILLIRGLSREKAHWDNFPEFITESIGLNVYCIDLPGMGEFNYLSSPINLHENTLFLRKRWLELKEKNSGEWIILGISLGGMVCLDWACNFNDDAKRFFVLNSSVKGISSLFERMSPFGLFKMSLALTSNGPSQERHIFELTSVKESKSKIGVDTIDSWVNIRNKRPITKLNFFRQLISAMKYRAMKKKITNLTFLAGKQDRLCSYNSSIKLGKFFDSPVYLCEENAGHDFALDRPDFIIEQIRAELEKSFDAKLKKDSTFIQSEFIN